MREHVAKNLLQARERANISQEELAMRAGLHRTEIGLLERGERLPRVDTLVKVAGGLGITPCVLLEGITWDPGVLQHGQFEVSLGDRD